MRVIRGRQAGVEADREVTAALVAHTRRTREPGLRVWYPLRHVAFGRRDRAAEGYEAARAAAAEHGYPPVERDVGGRAVAFTGDVLAVVRVEPAEPSQPAIAARYEAMLTTLTDAFRSLDIAVTPGEPPASFCPGTRSLQADGKVAGLAQRVRRSVAIVAGAVVVRDAAAVAKVLEPIYGALGVPFDPDSVGSLEAAGGVDPTAVRRAVEAAAVGDAEPDVRET